MARLILECQSIEYLTDTTFVDGGDDDNADAAVVGGSDDNVDVLAMLMPMPRWSETTQQRRQCHGH